MENYIIQEEIEMFVEILLTLTPDDRKQIINGIAKIFCLQCGYEYSKNGKCNCNNVDKLNNK